MNPLVAKLLQSDPNLRRRAAGKQFVEGYFFDTKTVLAAGLGTPGGPVPRQWFDGLTATDPTLTNVVGKNPMEYTEVAIICGISVTPLAIHTVSEGANAAAVQANISRDVDLFIKRSSLKLKVGTNDYPVFPVQSLGGDGGLGGIEGGVASTAAALVEVRHAPVNGSRSPNQFMKWFNTVTWYGEKPVQIEITGATGALSADLPVRVGLYCTYIRNTKPESPGVG